LEARNIDFQDSTPSRRENFPLIAPVSLFFEIGNKHTLALRLMVFCVSRFDDVLARTLFRMYCTGVPEYNAEPAIRCIGVGHQG
jgi:hypothetical protein